MMHAATGDIAPVPTEEGYLTQPPPSSAARLASEPGQATKGLDAWACCVMLATGIWHSVDEAAWRVSACAT